MSNYRRQFDPGGMFFFTVVTAGRWCLFLDERARLYLRNAIRIEQAEHPFDLIAIALLPNHLHCIWKLPEADSDYSSRWSRIKRRVTKQWIAAGGDEAAISKTRHERRERGVWQKRFWEHRVRDEEDMIRHVNHIHYNPVKHGLVHCAHAWVHSSFHRWVKEGYYRQDWLCDCGGGRVGVPDFAQISVAGE